MAGSDPPCPLRVVEVGHPAVQEHLRSLRDPGTGRERFRFHLGALARLLAYEATRPEVFPEVGERPAIVVPVLRAGLGMLAGVLDVFADSEVGFVGLRRDEQTLEAEHYMTQLPASLSGRVAVVVDPMVATGGSLAGVVALLRERGAVAVVAIGAVVAPEAVDRLGRDAAGLVLVCASVDERLDDAGFIVPGLGDAGDRLFGSR